jgi:pimeloyl-ACP methyl ester carboxylesterase
MTMRGKILIGLVILLGLLIGSPVEAESNLPTVEPAPCPIDVPQDADIECGVLVAPEDYDLPDGRVVHMPYIIIHSDHPEETPLLFTEGGPGGDSLRSVWMFEGSVLVEDRDLIIFQQRGNLHTDPSLECTLAELYDPETNRSPCKDKFSSAGIDLTQYHTAVTARDIESLRVALGYETWNLLGMSYSTRVMQVLMDRYPDGIRSVILQSVSPLHETRYQHDPEHAYRALEVMFADCAADPGCAEAYPDLEERFFSLVAYLNLDPIWLDLVDPADGSPYRYEVSGRTLINWMAGRAFYQPAHPPYPIAFYPMLIDQLDAGVTTALAPWAQNELNKEIFDPSFIAFGQYFAVNCQDDASSVTLDDIQVQAYLYPQMGGYFRHQGEWDLCQLWDLPDAPPLSADPISSEIPTLVLAGRYDPITPPEWARTVAENLENSYYFEFPSKGHSLDIATTCAEEIKRSFLLDPGSEPDSGCLAFEPPADFVLPDEVLPVAGLIRSVEDINYGVPEQGKPSFEILTGVSLIISLLEVLLFLGLSVSVLWTRTQRKEKQESLNYTAHILAAVTALLSIGTVALMSSVSWGEGLIGEMLLIFGLYQSTPVSTALGIVVLLHLVAGLALILVTISSLIQKKGTFLSRLALILVSLAAVTFWPFYFRWDLVDILFLTLGF